MGRLVVVIVSGEGVWAATSIFIMPELVAFAGFAESLTWKLAPKVPELVGVPPIELPLRFTPGGNEPDDMPHL